MLTYSIQIEQLLRKLTPKADGTRDLIQKKPYSFVFELLKPRVASNVLSKFQMDFEYLDGQCIDEIPSTEMEAFIKELKKILIKWGK